MQDRQGARRPYPSVGVAPSSSAAASPARGVPALRRTQARPRFAIRRRASKRPAGRPAQTAEMRSAGWPRGLRNGPQAGRTGGSRGESLLRSAPLRPAYSLRRRHSSPHRRPVLPSQPFSDTPCGAVGGWRATRLEAATARCSTSLLPFGRSNVFYGYASPVPGHKSNADQALRNLQIGKGGGSPTARNQNPSLRSESHHKGATDANATGGKGRFRTGGRRIQPEFYGFAN